MWSTSMIMWRSIRPLTSVVPASVSPRALQSGPAGARGGIAPPVTPVSAPTSPLNQSPMIGMPCDVVQRVERPEMEVAVAGRRSPA